MGYFIIVIGIFYGGLLFICGVRALELFNRGLYKSMTRRPTYNRLKECLKDAKSTEDIAYIKKTMNIYCVAVMLLGMLILLIILSFIREFMLF